MNEGGLNNLAVYSSADIKLFNLTEFAIQNNVEAWLKDIKYAIMALRNIESFYRVRYLTNNHRESIKECLDNLHDALQLSRKIIK